MELSCKYLKQIAVFAPFLCNRAQFHRVSVPLVQERGMQEMRLFICTFGGGNSERNRSGYQIRFETCLLDGILSFYEGETGRNGYTRDKEHLDALENEDSALWKHCLAQDYREKAFSSMKVLGVFFTFLVRSQERSV